MQVLAFLDHFGIADDDPRVNQYGGAIAVGHPLASSGVRLMTQLARQFEEHPEVRYGLTAMCIGIGMGGTVIWENPHYDGRGRRVSDHHDLLSARRASPRARSSPSAQVRDVDLPGGAGTLALITLDNGLDHTQPNTFGPQPPGRPATPRSTRSSAAAAGEIVGVGVTGKPFIFAVGADLTGVAAASTDARAGARASPAPATRCSAGSRTSPVPTFAFVNGARHGRRPRGRAALRLPHGLGRRAGARAARGLPRPGPRLGRHATCCRT